MPKEIIKEIMSFLSKKFDEMTSAIRNTPQKLIVDMSETSNKIDDLKGEVTSKTSELVEAINKLDNSESFSQTIQALNNLRETFDSKDLVVNIPDTSEKLEGIVKAIDKQTNELKPQKSEQVSGLLRDIVKAVKDIQLEEKSIDLSGIKDLVQEVKGLRKEVQDTSKIENALADVKKAVDEISLTVPSTIKLEEMQFRALKPKGSYQGPIPARNPIITRVTMTSSDTEYSHTFNKNAVMWRMKLESQDASFNYTWETGKLKESGDASAYISIPTNWLDSRDNSEYGTKTIYFESGTASQKMEIEEGVA